MRQKLGQHFLKNTDVLRVIIETLNVKASDILIEIGAGHGELTDIYVEGKKNRTILLERDSALVSLLCEKYHHLKNIQVMEGDAVEMLSGIIKKIAKEKKYKLFGNIPYYITGTLLRKISELKHKPEILVFLLQKEVALRIAAAPPKMNLLAASVQIWACPEVIQDVSRFDFDPPPEIDSAIIILRTLKRGIKNRSTPKSYHSFTRALFKQPRKTILNNLRGVRVKTGVMTKDELMGTLLKEGIEPNDRPQNLTVGQIIALSRIF